MSAFRPVGGCSKIVSKVALTALSNMYSPVSISVFKEAEACDEIKLYALCELELSA